MQLFYNPDITETDTQILFSKDESRHITKVLRKSSGDVLNITNGKGWSFEAKITIADLKHCAAEIISKTYHKAKPYKLHLAVAPTKMNDRYEWFLEKATEIGIDTVTPIICQNSERKVIKKERLEKITQSAMKQSLQYHLPHLNDAVSFKEFMAHNYSGQLFIAHCEDTDRKWLKTELLPNEDVLILIGPEGDFSTQEIDSAIKQGFTPVMLGDTRLRTETAAIVACNSVAFSNQS